MHNVGIFTSPWKKKTWRFLKYLGVGKDHISISNDVDLKHLNVHFSTTSTLDDMVNSETLRLLSSVPTPIIRPFVLRHFTINNVKKNLLAISSNYIENLQ